jgi:ribosome recycling factor
MLNKEDVQAIVQAMSPLIKAEGEAIRKDMVTKKDLEINNKVLGTIIRVELATAIQELNNEKIKQLEERVKTLEEKLSNVRVVVDRK